MNIQKKVKDALDGKINPLDAYAELKLYAKELADQIKEVEPLALDEAQKQPEKKFQYKGFLFEYRQGTPRYSYKNIDDWVQKQAELKAIEDRAKSAFKNANKGLTTVDGDGVVPDMPEVSYAKDSLSVRILG